MDINKWVEDDYNCICTDLKARKENASITANILKDLLTDKSQTISVEDALAILDDTKKLLPRYITF